MITMPNRVAHRRKRRSLPELSPETALLVFRLSYVGLIVGAALVLGSTLLAFWSDSEIKHHDSVRISDNERSTAEAKSEAARANESSKKLENETARLQAENLEIQKIMLPRRLKMDRLGWQLTWLEGRESAVHLFARELRPFPYGTQVWIQSFPDFEAQTLADDIESALNQIGWRTKIVTDAETGIS